jgi:RHS repeat-associated protein
MGSVPTDKLFTGQRLDGTGLYYYNARYYDPTIGRFISPDTVIQNPANPQCFNRYSYCLNNPLKYTDPSGHYTESEYWALAEAAKKLAESKALNKVAAATNDPTLLAAADSLLSQALSNINAILTSSVERISKSEENFTLVAEGFLLPSGIIVTTHVLSDLIKRGWTLQGIEDAYTNPFYTSPSTNLRNGNPATAYYRSSISGDYVVIDSNTMETLQIGDCYDPYWYPNPAIRNPIWGRNYQLPPGYYGPDMYGNWPR